MNITIDVYGMGKAKKRSFEMKDDGFFRMRNFLLNEINKMTLNKTSNKIEIARID